MKTLIERFAGSEHSNNPVLGIAFYLGVLCSIVRKRNRQEYVDKIVKERLVNFHNFEDLQKLDLQLERLLLNDDGISKIYREKISDYFMKATKSDFGDGSKEMMLFGAGLSMGDSIDEVMTFAEATEKWGLGHSTLREAAKHNRFLPGETRKSGGTWLVTEEAMRRLYGEPKRVKDMQYYRKGNIIIEQCGWEWANDYTFSSDDYEVGSVVCQSTTEWLEQGYKQIDKQELIDELEARGYVVDIEDYLED